MGTNHDPAGFLGARRVSLAQYLIAEICDVPLAEMRGRTRGRPAVAQARQIAIYIAKVVFAMTYGDLAQEFRRDASTIRHACVRIEGMREASREFDASMRWYESRVRSAAGLEP